MDKVESRVCSVIAIEEEFVCWSLCDFVTSVAKDDPLLFLVTAEKQGATIGYCRCLNSQRHWDALECFWGV